MVDVCALRHTRRNEALKSNARAKIYRSTSALVDFTQHAQNRTEIVLFRDLSFSIGCFWPGLLDVEKSEDEVDSS